MGHEVGLKLGDLTRLKQLVAAAVNNMVFILFSGLLSRLYFFNRHVLFYTLEYPSILMFKSKEEWREKKTYLIIFIFRKQLA